MRKIAILFGAYDGICSHYCGVGTMAKDFLLSFYKIISHLQVKCEIYPICTLNTSFATSDKTEKEINNLIQKYPDIYKGIRWIDNGTSGGDPYGNVNNWMILCSKVVEEIYNISCDYDATIFIGQDGPYLGCATLFFKRYCAYNVFFINIFYSSVLYNRALPYDKITNYARLGWEYAAVLFSKKNPAHSMIYGNGKSFAEYLSSCFEFKEVIPYVNNGLNIDRMKSKIVSQNIIASHLEEYSIPLDKSLMFTVGRCEQAKGFEYVIHFAGLMQRYNIHTVILMSQCEQNLDYYKKIKSLSNKNYITLIDKRDMELPSLIYQWKNTRIAVEFALRESAGLLPAEARFYKRAIVVVSDIPGLAEQITDGKDGLVSSVDSKTMSKTAKRVIDILENDYEEIIRNGYKKVIENYDSVVTYKKFLDKICKDFGIICNN